MKFSVVKCGKLSAVQYISYTQRLFLTHNELQHLFVPFMHLLIILSLGQMERNENELEKEKEKKL